MGYTTDFEGRFELDKPLSPEHFNYLEKFAQTRRMKRNPEITKTYPDPVREAAGLPIGKEGEFFVGDNGYFGQTHSSDILDYNNPPSTQPGLWCQWTPSEDRMGIEWDGSEKFYYYTKWIEYLIKNFLKPWGYTVNGHVQWYGEDRGDIGQILILNNAVVAKKGQIVFAH